MLRKTGYLFAMWGILEMYTNVPSKLDLNNLVMANIMMSARHRSLSNAGTYAKDAMTLYAFLKRAQSAHNNHVGPWEAIHVTGSVGTYLTNNVQSR